MSNYLAIATVTAALNQLLSNGIHNDPGLSGVNVSNQPPDVVISRTPQDTLNIFLFHVSPNRGYRNVDQPVRRSGGEIGTRPQLGLDLQYMITAIAAENDDVQAHKILASAMRTLHESPVLTREMIRQTISSDAALTSSDLADQVELVKFTPQGLTLEEITKLWSSFFQTNYRISATYEATVVLLDSVYESRPGLPVVTPQVTTLLFRQPVIHEVQPQILPYDPAAVLTITGENLRGDVDVAGVTVLVGGGSATPSPPSLSDIKVTIPLSTVVIPGGGTLTPGVKTVQVVQGLNLPSPGGTSLHRGFESNIVPFVLAPTLTSPPPSSVARGSILTVNFQPAVAPEQRASFLLGSNEIPVPQRDPTSSPVAQLSVQIPATVRAGMNLIPFPTGTFLFRLRVDNADSPTSGPFTQPMVQVT